MKKLLIAAVFAVSFAAVAHADRIGPGWMPMEQVLTKLKGLGYTDITKIEADDGYWEADASKDGVRYEIHMDPRTGTLTKNEPKH